MYCAGLVSGTTFIRKYSHIFTDTDFIGRLKSNNHDIASTVVTSRSAFIYIIADNKARNSLYRFNHRPQNLKICPVEPLKNSHLSITVLPALIKNYIPVLCFVDHCLSLF